MKAFLTTSFSVLALDTCTLEAPIFEKNRGLYYGITVRQKDVYVAARRRQISSAVPIEEERGCLIQFDADLEPELIEAPFPLRDLHGAIWNGDELLLACSYDNCIARYRRGTWSMWHPLGKQVEDPRDRNHFNTFFLERDTLYLVAHNWGDSELISFSRHDYRLLDRQPLGKQAHNVWRHGDALMVCSSGEGKLVATDGTERTAGEFPRGYARTGGTVLIGLTKEAKREDRNSHESSVLVTDTEYVPSGQIVLPGQGMILDIVSVSDAMYDAAMKRSKDMGYGSVQGVRYEP